MEYLDSKRPLSPLSPLSDSPESNKLSTKTKKAEVHHIHNHKNKDKNRDSAVKVIPKYMSVLYPAFLLATFWFISALFDLYTQPKMEVECVKVSGQPQPPSESWGPAGHRGTMPNHET